jgi:sugar lactone lactonase YvrE
MSARGTKAGISVTLDFSLIADTKCRLGESPVYDERTNRIYFVDILGREILGLNLGSGERGSWKFESEVGSIGLAVSGRMVVALRHSVILFDLASGADLPTRLNDGRVGADGAFWVGSMDDRKEKEPIGALYRIDASGNAERKVEGLLVSNGLAWTADGERMFHADSRGPWIDRWRFDRQSGTISDRERFAVLDEATGRPDGGSCDAEGFYWSAGVSAGRLNRLAPDGRIAESYDVPVPAPTMPVFGGPDFRTLYLTSLREGRSEEALAKGPWAGSLIATPMKVAGFPGWRFLDVP